MQSFVIQGGRPLSGTIRASGNKNGALPCLAATILTEDEVLLRNIPRIRDVEAMVELLERLGFEILEVEMVPDVSSSAVRHALKEGDVVAAAGMLGRPYELDGIVVAGDQRGGTLGYPTANLALEPQLGFPRYGIYAGSALGHRAAVSIGTIVFLPASAAAATFVYT